MFTPEQNKEIVVDFYDQAFNRNQPKEASAAYIGNVYVQHHPGVPDGPDALSGHVTQLRKSSRTSCSISSGPWPKTTWW